MTTFLIFRVLHILLAAIWVGGTFVATFFFVPAIQDAKAAGGQVMSAVAKRGYIMFVPSMAGLVTLSGLYLYYKFTAGFDPGISGSMAGRVFGTGGIAGILAAIIGSGVGRKVKKVVAIMQQAAPMPEGPQKTTLLQQAAALQRSMGTSNRITLVLMLIALITMSIGHYV